MTEVCVTPAGEIAISNATINTAFFLPESLSERERADCRADEQKRGDERGTPNSGDAVAVERGMLPTSGLTSLTAAGIQTRTPALLHPANR